MSKPPPPPLQLGSSAASPHSTGADGPPPPSSSSSAATPTTQHHHATSQNGNANHPQPGSSASSPSAGSAAPTIQGAAAAASAPTAQPAAPPAYPALHLTPLNGTFVPKQISLDHTTSGGRVKIGRQINAKTVPNATNGYFDSKVLSRAHAEVWSEDGKVFIKDVKSSNGTFINGERLSPESTESDVFELHTDDIVEFGIDILTDDTKQIVHHKVAAKVHLVLNAEDAIASHREINNWYRSAGEQSLNRSRATAPPRSSGGGGGGLPSSQSGLSFEHVLSRLQGELQKSRDTGVNLTDVNSTLTVVHDTFSGGPAPSLPPGAGIPRGFSNPRNGGQHTQQQQQQQQLQQQAANEAHAQSIAALQAQLNETQSSLQGHVGKIRELEGLLAEHDTIKREVGGLRAQIELAQESMSALMRDRERQGYGRGGAAATNGRESPLARMLEAGEEDDDDEVRESGARKGGDLGDDDDDEEEEQEEADDDDDTRSIVSVETVTAASPRLLNGSGGGGGDDKRRQRGPSPLDADADDDDAPTSSPPPSSTPALVISSDDGNDTEQGTSNADALAASNKRERLLEEQNGKLVARLEALSLELSEATQLGAALRTRHAEASETIKLLEQRIVALERAVDQRVAEAEGKVLEKVEQTWTGWRERFEQSWKEERLSWEGEREALRKLVKGWEERKRLKAVEMAALREAAAHNNRADEDEEDGGSSSGSDDVADAASTLSPMTGSPARTTSSKKSRSSRRRKRSSLTPVPPSLSAPAASARLSELARHVVDGRGGAGGVDGGAGPGGGGGGVASDSDSTIGEPLGGGGDGAGANRFKRDGASGRAGLGGSSSSSSAASSGQDVTRGSGKASEHGGLPLSVAGAVVVLAVAVGYGAAMKLKE